MNIVISGKILPVYYQDDFIKKKRMVIKNKAVRFMNEKELLIKITVLFIKKKNRVEDIIRGAWYDCPFLCIFNLIYLSSSESLALLHT